MARIYGDNEGAYTDHGKAFKLYKALADELQDVDPDDDESGADRSQIADRRVDVSADGIADAGVSPRHSKPPIARCSARR